MAWWSRRGAEPPTSFEQLPGGAAMAAQVMRPGFLGKVSSTEASNPRSRLPKRSAEAWQSDCWDAFDATPAVKFLVRYDANAISKCRLVVGVLTEPGLPPIPLTDDTQAELGVPDDVRESATVELGRLQDCLGGQSLLLKLCAMHFRVAGECWLLGFPPVEAVAADDFLGIREVKAMPERWEVRAAEEVETKDDDAWVVADTAGGQKIKLPEDVFVARLWEPHPRRRQKADSNLRTLLLDCDILLALSKQTLAVARSRVAFGGILAVSTDADFGPADPSKVDDPDTATAEPLTQDLIDHFSTPIQDEGSASAIAPYIMRLATDIIERGLKYIPLTREVDRWSQTERKDAIARIGIGMDAPPEVLTGYGDVNKWNGLLVDEAKFASHHEPLVISICSSLTVGAFRQLLDAHEPAIAPEWQARLVVWFDASDLIVDGTRGEDVRWALENNVIGPEAARRELHFDEEDAPDVEATADETPGEPSPEFALVASAARPRNEVAARAGRRLGAIDAGLRARLGEAADAALARALDRAGARLRSRVAGAGVNGRLSGSAFAAIQNVPNSAVCATLGRAQVRVLAELAEDQDDSALLDEAAFDALAVRYASMVGNAQRQARAELRRLGLDEHDLDLLEQRQDRDRDTSWSWLAGSLLGLAGLRLFDPHPGTPDGGEQPVSSAGVPAGIIRESLGRAGGSAARVNDSDGIVDEDGRPVGGAVTGRTIGDALDSSDTIVSALVWDYGDIGLRMQPFEPHLDLDGVEFESWDDPVLEGYYVGDHFSCACGWYWSLSQAATVADEQEDAA